jgi:hypothetical protein
MSRRFVSRRFLSRARGRDCSWMTWHSSRLPARLHRRLTTRFTCRLIAKKEKNPYEENDEYRKN